MQRFFNTEGPCEPEFHYMVRLYDRLDQIKRLYIDMGKYFVINRGRQYGKTTTLCALEGYLQEDYYVVSMDFQGISTAEFSDEYTFVRAFLRMFAEAFEDSGAGMEEVGRVYEFMKQSEKSTLGEMFYLISGLCKTAGKPVVLLIDEVDSAGNNQVFIDFLALLRQYYIKRRKKPTFHSVVLAGVYDIKNLKLKIRPEQEHQYNSPWNIAAAFDVDMSFSQKQIAVMLGEYEADRQTGMDVPAVAEEIYQYTSGYPYLVSTICKILDEKLPFTEEFSKAGKAWSRQGITEAVKCILNTNTPLFDSMVKQLDTYQDLRSTIEAILYQGERVPYNPDERALNMGVMFGFIKNVNGQITMSNRIFEMRMLNMFIAKEAVKSEEYSQGQRDRNQFITNARLNMELVLEKFVAYFNEIYSASDEKFIEKYGRKFFLLYLKPIINGTGNYYLEAQTLNAGRTDLVVDYRGEQFVIEMKIWHGKEYNERGEEQLKGYLEYFHLKKGYMLSFNFNKKKETGIHVITLGDKTIVEAVV